MVDWKEGSGSLPTKWFFIKDFVKGVGSFDFQRKGAIHQRRYF